MTKITHEEALNFMSNNITTDMKHKEVKTVAGKLREYITQQQKKDELLELYREKDKLQDDKLFATPKRRTVKSSEIIAEFNRKIYAIKDKINELEKDLK